MSANRHADARRRSATCASRPAVGTWQRQPTFRQNSPRERSRSCHRSARRSGSLRRSSAAHGQRCAPQLSQKRRPAGFSEPVGSRPERVPFDAKVPPQSCMVKSLSSALMAGAAGAGYGNGWGSVVGPTIHLRRSVAAKASGLMRSVRRPAGIRCICSPTRGASTACRRGGKETFAARSTRLIGRLQDGPVEWLDARAGDCAQYRVTHGVIPAVPAVRGVEEVILPTVRGDGRILDQRDFPRRSARSLAALPLQFHPVS